MCATWHHESRQHGLYTTSNLAQRWGNMASSKASWPGNMASSKATRPNETRQHGLRWRIPEEPFGLVKTIPKSTSIGENDNRSENDPCDQPHERPDINNKHTNYYMMIAPNYHIPQARCRGRGNDMFQVLFLFLLFSRCQTFICPTDIPCLYRHRAMSVIQTSFFILRIMTNRFATESLEMQETGCFLKILCNHKSSLQNLRSNVGQARRHNWDYFATTS